MSRYIKSSLLMLCAWSLLLAQTQAVTILVDNFTDAQSLSHTGAGPFALGPSTTPGGMLGGFRTMSLSGTGFPGQTVAFNIGFSYGDYESASLSDGVGSLVYDGNGAGLGSAAGTNAARILIDAFNVGRSPTNLRVSITDTASVTDTVTIPLTTSILAPTIVTFDFTASSVNFSALQSIALIMDSVNAAGADLTVSRFELVDRNPVPEPSTLAITAAGLAALAGLTLRRRT